MRANPFEGQLERLARTLTEQFGGTVRGNEEWRIENVERAARRAEERAQRNAWPAACLGRHP
jgi:hypothetical protein